MRSGNSHITSRLVSFTLYPIFGGLLRPSFVSPRRIDGPPSIWEIHMVYREMVFANQPATSSILDPPESNFLKENC